MVNGSVCWPPAVNSVRENSSYDSVNENSIALSTPGKINGKVMRRKVVAGLTPRVQAASSSERSKRVKTDSITREGHGGGVGLDKWARKRLPHPGGGRAENMGRRRDAQADQDARHDHAQHDQIKDQPRSPKAPPEGLRRKHPENRCDHRR